MTREEKLEAIAEKLKEGETIIVSVRHKGKFDGCHCYSLTKNKIVSQWHEWNCKANFMEMYHKYVKNGGK